jgi:hypothetical protein
VDVRRERRDHDAALRTAEDLLQPRADAGFARREAGAVGVRRVAAEAEHALAAELREPRDVGRDPIHRRLVELVVAGHEHRPELGARGDRDAVGDRVRHVDELDVERPEREPLAGAHVGDIDLPEAVLVELRARHRRGERRAVDRDVAAELAQDPRQRAEMVLVPVRDHDPLDVVLAPA